MTPPGGHTIVGVGQCALDYLGAVDAFPPADSKCEFNGLTIQGGGPVATALVALSRWGLRCAFNGVVGDDAFGAAIRASLEDERVDTSGLVTRAGRMSQFAFIAAEPGSGRRTIFWQRPTGAPLRPDELDMARIRQCRILHTDGLFAEASLAACREAAAAGAAVTVDAGTLRPGMLELIPFSRCYIASETFARALVDGDDPDGACRRMAELGAPFAGVTLGDRGYVALVDGRWIRGEADAVEAVDTTGCGDVFHAGVIYGMVRRWSAERSLRFAVWAAARVSRHLGGRTGIPNPEDFSTGDIPANKSTGGDSKANLH